VTIMPAEAHTALFKKSLRLGLDMVSSSH